jgi:hypothetical protein
VLTTISDSEQRQELFYGGNGKTTANSPLDELCTHMILNLQYFWWELLKMNIELGAHSSVSKGSNDGVSLAKLLRFWIQFIL